MIKKRGRIVRMDTASTTMIIDAERAEYIYYGERLHSATERMDGVSSGRKIFSTPGKDAYLEYGAVFENADGGFAADFVYTHGKILPEKPIVQGLPSAYGEGKTLELKYTDAGTKVCLYLYYTVYEDSDVIVVSSKLVNGSKKEIRVRRHGVRLFLQQYGGEGERCGDDARDTGGDGQGNERHAACGVSETGRELLSEYESNGSVPRGGDCRKGRQGFPDRGRKSFGKRRP